MMQLYNGYYISGKAQLVHPFSPDWYVGGSVFVRGRSSSIVEFGRFQLQQLTVSMKGLAESGLLLLMDAYLIVSPYRYFHLAAPHGLVRVNRFTGEAEKL